MLLIQISREKFLKLSQRILWEQLQSSSVVSPPIHCGRAAAITIVSGHHEQPVRPTSSKHSASQQNSSKSAGECSQLCRAVHIGKPQRELAGKLLPTHLPLPTLCTATSCPCQLKNQQPSSPGIELHTKLALSLLSISNMLFNLALVITHLWQMHRLTKFASLPTFSPHPIVYFLLLQKHHWPKSSPYANREPEETSGWEPGWYQRLLHLVRATTMATVSGIGIRGREGVAHIRGISHRTHTWQNQNFCLSILTDLKGPGRKRIWKSRKIWKNVSAMIQKPSAQQFLMRWLQLLSIFFLEEIIKRLSSN